MQELYTKLFQQELYTNSFEQFKIDYGSPEGARELYNKLAVQSDLYTNSFSDFQRDYSIGLPESQPTSQGNTVKRNIGSTMLDVGVTRSSATEEDNTTTGLFGTQIKSTFDVSQNIQMPEVSYDRPDTTGVIDFDQSLLNLSLDVPEPTTSQVPEYTNENDPFGLAASLGIDTGTPEYQRMLELAALLREAEQKRLEGPTPMQISEEEQRITDLMMYGEEPVEEEPSEEDKEKEALIAKMREEGAGILESQQQGYSSEENLVRANNAEKPEIQGINNWYTENSDRLNKIELDTPVISPNATAEEIQKAQEAMQEQWSNKVEELYNQEVVEPYNEALKVYQKAVATKEKTKAREIVTEVINNNIGGWWSEENMAKNLKEVLPVEYQIEEGIGEYSEGTATRLSVNNITITNSHGVARNFNLRSSTEFAKELFEFLEEDPTLTDEKGEEWVEQKEAFSRNWLDNYFGEGGSGFHAFMDDPQRVEDIQAGIITIDDALKEIKGRLGTEDAWTLFGEKVRQAYPALTDSDIDHIIKERYHAEIEAHKNKGLDNLAAGFDERLLQGDITLTELHPGVPVGEHDPDRNTLNYNVNVYQAKEGRTVSIKDAEQFFKTYTASQINTIEDPLMRELASINMLLDNQENLRYAEIQFYLNKRDQIIQQIKEEGGEYEMLFDLTTGQLIRPVGKDNPFVTENTEDVTGEIQQQEKELRAEFASNPHLTPRDMAREAYEKNAKALAVLNAQLNEVQRFEFYRPELTLEERVQVSEPSTRAGVDVRDMTVREALIKSNYADGAEDFIEYHTDAFGSKVQGGQIMYFHAFSADGVAQRNILRQQMRDLKIQQEALKRIYLLNEDVISIEKNNAQNYTKLAIMSLPFAGTIGNMLAPETMAFGGVPTEREVIDEYIPTLTNAGIEIRGDQKAYVDRSFGEQFGEGLASSAGILVEFAIANKAAAALRTARIFSGGTKSLDMILKAHKAKRYWNGKQALTVAQATAAANNAKLPLSVYLAQGGYNATKSASLASKVGVFLTESTIEGAKFASLPSSSGARLESFATGFGFGGATQILSPMLGTINASTFSPAFQKTRFGAMMANNAPRLEKIYNLAFKGPLSFTVGSEVGELGLALTDDLMGYEEFSGMIEEHYGDGSSNLQRWASNWAMGTAFGFTHAAAYKKAGTIESLREAKKEAEDAIFETRDNYVIRNKKTGEVFEAPSKKNYQTKDFEIIERPGMRKWRTKKKNGEPMTQEYLVDMYQLSQNLSQQLRRSEDGLDLIDRTIGASRLKTRTLEQVKHYKEKGANVEVEYGSPETYIIRDKRTGKVREVNKKPSGSGAANYEILMEPMGNRNAEVYYKDKDGNIMDVGLMGKKVKGSTVVVRYNVEKFAEGYAPHELGHSGMEILFGTNARFKSDFVQKLMGIAKEIKLGVGPDGELPLFENLYDQIVEQNRLFDVEKTPWEAAKAKDWELFSHIAEHLSKPENLRELRKANAFGKVRDLVRQTVGKELNQEYNFTKEADIVEFFGNYIESINRGKNSLKVLEHLQDVIAEPSSPEAREMERLYNEQGIHFTETSRLASESNRRRDLIKENVDLFKNKPEGYEAKMQENIQAIRSIDDLLVINRPAQNESDNARKERVNRIHAGHKDVMFSKDLVGRDAQRQGEAIDAIISSYRGKTIAVAKSQGRFETPTFENMSKSEREDFAWDITRPELLKHLDAFNRKFRETDGKEGIENDDLDAYLNSYIVNKLGTALKRPGIEKTEFTGTTTDLKPSQEPAYTPSEMKLNNKTDARLRIDIRERLTDNAPEERKSKIQEGIKEHGKFVKDYIETTSDAPTSYRDLKNIKTPKEIVDKVFGKNTAERIETIGRTLDIAKKSALPEGTLSTRTGNVELEGKAIGVANTLQTINIAKKGQPANYKEVLYGTPKKFAEFVSKETGRLTAEADPTGQGNTPKELLKLSRAETLKRLGIKEVEVGGGEVRYDIDNTLAKEYASEPGSKSEKAIARNIEGIRKNYMEEVVRGMTYQVAMENLPAVSQKLGIATEILANQISAGKARLASKTLEMKDFTEQMEFLDQIESKEFKDLYEKAVAEREEKAFEHAMITHFANNPVENISKTDIKNIAKQLEAQFTFTTMTPKRAIEASMKAIAYPKSLQSIEAKYGFEALETKNLYDTIEGIREGQAAFTMEGGIIETLTRTKGKGAFEALIKEGVSKGAGLGTYRSHREYEVRNKRTGKVTKTNKRPSKSEIENAENPLEILSETLIKTAEQNMIEGNTEFRSDNRFALFETAAKAQEAADGVYARLESEGVKLKDYEGSSRANSDAVGKKKRVLEGVTGKDGAWDLKAREEFDRIGEENKKALFDGKGKSSVVEAMKDMYVNGDITYRQVRQIVEGQGGPMEGLIKKSASLAVLPETSRADIEAVYGKNWVLEHTTPAQYVKARIYDYILSGGKAPQAKALKLTLRDYHTTLIPESLDTMVNKILKTDLPSFHVPGMDPIESRYYMANHKSPFDLSLVNYRNNKVYSKTGLSVAEISRRGAMLRESYAEMISPRLASKNLEPTRMLEQMETMKKAVANSRNPRAKKKGMSTFDFDETLIVDGENFVVATKDGKRVEISSEKWPIEGPKYAEQGYEFDFSDFANVRGGTDGPLLQKMRNQISKYGSNNVFVLTARQQASAEPIHSWLKSKGIDIPLENITGLGKSEGAAKAQWMLEKFAEGYNDMYFVDDALPNVEAVREVLSQLDIKSNVQQARRLASKDMNLEFNQMIERKTGIGYQKIFSGAKGKMLGKRRYTQSIVVPGAQDFMGLMQNFMGKGKRGDADRAFFEENLVKPFARATKEMNEARQRSSEDLKALYKDIPSVKRKLNKRLPGSAFTYDQAIRTYLWEKNGFNIPELSMRDLKSLTDVVNKDVELRNFAEQLNMIGKGTWVEPSANWIGETIVSDLFNLNNKARRAEYLQEWQENIDTIFSPTNLNKIEATQGSKFREALEDSIYRMKTGSNRPTGANRLTNQFNNWINGSVGATMFLNMRSAMLQTISATNYINWSFNNPVAAARAFGNQKQYWKDFSMLWNSPMLKQRRSGLEYNVQEAELAAAMAGQKNKAKAAVAWLIKKGFTPTQVADSFAICGGGATYYRNKVRELTKQGVSKAEAQERAFLEFQELTETNQQSSRADLISQQQASGLGRTILAWSNTPMQYMRIQEKAARDIVNGRGDLKANMSKIAYYGVIQSAIFSSLQNALFRWGLEEEDENNEADNKDLNASIDRTVNTVIDSQLRGTGVLGAALSAIRNTVLEFEKQEAKAYDDSFLSSPDHSRTVLQLTSFSPVISSKLRKLYSAGNEWNYNREAISEMGFDIDNPAIHAGANVLEAVTNLPFARLVQKVDNIQGVLDSNNETWQRVALLMGYPKWQLGIEDTEVEEAKQRGRDRIKAIKDAEREIEKQQKEIVKADEELAEIEDNILDQDEEREQGAKEVQCAAVSRSGKRCSNMALPGENFCTIHMPVPQQKDEVQCSHIKKDGKRCKMKTKNKSGKCYYHD